jgi:DNA-binding response OmpR family regulator
MRNKVLFVDSNSHWQRLFAQTGPSETEGIDPIVVDSGQAAVKMLASTDISVVVCEPSLPDMEIAQWRNHLRRIYPDIR